MLNLTRMNIYRMIRTKCIWVILLITCSFGALSAQMSCYDMQMDEEMQASGITDAEDSEEEDTSFTLGIQTTVPDKENGHTAPFMLFFFSNLQSGILLIFLAIASVLFVHQEHKTGFVKNIAGQTARRSSLYLSKLVVLTGYTLLTAVSYFLSFYVVLRLNVGSELSFGWKLLTGNLDIIAISLLLHLAFISGLAMLTTMSRSSTIGITFGMFASMGMGFIMDGFLYYLIHFHVSKYYITTNLRNMTPGASGKSMWLALAVALTLIIVYNGAGTIWFSKRDAV